MKVTPGVVATPKTPERPLLKRGDKGMAVADLQRMLGIKADGDFGRRRHRP